MPLTLYVDEQAWRAHHQRVVAERSRPVPVAKGNGYGFTLPVLARAAAALEPDVDQIAVGTADEAAQVLALYPNDIVVLEPLIPGAAFADLPERVIYTAGSVDAVRALADRRMVVDCRSSLHRQGVARSDLPAVKQALGGRQPEGYSLHMPIDRPRNAPQRVGEIEEWINALQDEGLKVPVFYVSHVTGPELAELRVRFPGTRIRVRIGTDLWLGASDAIEARATVLDVLPVSRGERIGYRQNRLRHGGWVVVVSGGALQGVGLDAPRTLRGVAPRAKEAGRSGLRMMNRALSPFSWAGRRQWFAEPPHMSISMLYLPEQIEPPEPGSELTADVRYTATHFDRVRMH